MQCVKGYLSGVVHWLASLRLAVWAILLFMLVVFFGTLYQVEHGLHAAQQDFYYAWLTPPISQWHTPSDPGVFSRLLAFLPLPLPGGMTLLWVLSINLLLSMVLKFRYGWRNIGSVLTHAGLLLLLAGGWVTHITAEEGYLTLQEGESSNVAASYTQWEIALWEGEQIEREVYAFPANDLKAGDQLYFEQVDLHLEVQTYHRNAEAFIDPDAARDTFNVAGITRLAAAPLGKNPEAYLPGVVLRARMGDGGAEGLILYAGDPSPVMLVVDDAPWFLELRRRRIPLPLQVQLHEFRAEFEPNTTIPRSFSSRINVTAPGIDREVVVEMNRPFRHAGFTFFQSSYGEADDGSDMSTFTVVLNQWMLAPYVATGVTVFGLIVHFMVQMLRPRRELRREGT